MTHVLTYFAFPGRAFVARVCFGTAKVPYENKLVSFQEFGALKPSLPLGSVPVLTLPSGRVVCQSGAINRYAATLAKLYGTSAEDSLLQDEVILSAEELMNKVPQLPDADAKKAARQAFATDTMPRWLTLLEDRLGAGPYYGGDKLNLADLTVFAVTSAIKKGQWDFIDGAVLDPYPGLVKHHDLVLVHPAVTEHAIYM